MSNNQTNNSSKKDKRSLEEEDLTFLERNALSNVLKNLSSLQLPSLYQINGRLNEIGFKIVKR